MQPDDSAKPVVVREPDASKGARPVLRGEPGREAGFLPSRALILSTALLLAACAQVPQQPEARTDVPVLMLGEQHDAAEHQQLHRQVVEALSDRGVLAALAIEMAERGHSTAALPPTATEAEVRAALAWEPRGWPWEPYAPAIMAAVRAGVPVVGANLPRAEMRNAMADTSLDVLLPGPALKAQQQAIRIGHCQMLPESQIQPMTRVQIARDRAMAQTLASLVQPDKTVVLLAGAGHVDPQLGIPNYLPRGLEAKPVVLTPVDTGVDHCAEFQKQRGGMQGGG